MGRLKKSILVLGEGPTEYYYCTSLKDDLKGLTVKPDYPKHTNLRELRKKILEGVELGYSHIFCVIDMDTKLLGPERSQYEQLKRSFSKPIDKPKKGIHCEISFFETHNCTELFFLYYFRYTSREFKDQVTLLNALNKEVYYQKTNEFFKKCGGLHNYFLKKGGSFEKAIKNSKHSMEEKNKDAREHTYSDLGRMMDLLKELETNNSSNSGKNTGTK